MTVPNMLKNGVTVLLSLILLSTSSSAICHAYEHVGHQESGIHHDSSNEECFLCECGQRPVSAISESTPCTAPPGKQFHSAVGYCHQVTCFQAAKQSRGPPFIFVTA